MTPPQKPAERTAPPTVRTAMEFNADAAEAAIRQNRYLQAVHDQLVEALRATQARLQRWAGAHPQEWNMGDEEANDLAEAALKDAGARGEGK